jgi:curved DNA-binding protein CbpA
VTADPYRVLGISPGTDEATIRAAYRRLMKRFHPDRNRSADAADRAREVAAAYALLSDPEQRSRLDRERRYREQVIAPAPPPLPPRVPRGRLGGLLLVALSIVIMAFAIIRFDPQLGSRPSPATPMKVAADAGDVVSEPALRPAPSARLADADLRPPSAPAAQAPHPALGETKVAALSPPSPRDLRSLPASAANQTAALGAATTDAPPPKLPIDDCQTGATCASIDLAALERMQSLLDRQSQEFAPAAKQGRLLTTRAVFQARLDRCASAACKRDAYLARNREIAELMRS